MTTGRSNHDRIRDQVAEYAMEVLAAGEREEVRRHLHTCEPCRADLEDFERTISWLTVSAAPIPLPVGFTERLLADARPGDETQEATAASRRPEEHRAAPPAPRRLRAGLLAVALVLLAGVATWSTLELTEVRGDVRDQGDAIEALVRGEDRIELTSSGDARGVIVPVAGASLFVATDLPKVAQRSVYQLWIKDGAVITSGGTFESSGGTAIVRLERRFGDFSGALVTIEPGGGSEQPTSVAVVDSI